MLISLRLNKPVEYFSSGQTVVSNGWIHPARIIDTFVLIVGLEGKIYLQQEKEKYVLSEGDVIILIPGLFHTGYLVNENVGSYLWCHFKCDSWQIINHDNFPPNFFANNNDNVFILPSYFRCYELDKVILLLRSIINYGRNFDVSHKICNYLLSALLIELSYQAEKFIAKGYEEFEDAKIKYLLEFIRANSNRPLNLKDYANRFNYNPFYISRLLKKHFGMGFKQFIINSRLQKAKKLLLTTPLSIKEIAFSCGFKDEKYFMKVFKKYEKMTPSEYRNAFSSIHINTS